MPIVRAIKTAEYMMYDGTNSAEMLAAAQARGWVDATIVSETGGVLTLLLFPQWPDQISVLSASEYLALAGPEVITAAAWAAQFIVKA